MRRKSPVSGHASSGVVTATGSIVWSAGLGWVGMMNWFMMASTSALCQVGVMVPPMINAVDAAESRTPCDRVGSGAGTPWWPAPRLRQLSRTDLHTSSNPSSLLLMPSVTKSAMDIVIRADTGARSNALLHFAGIKLRHY
jgi:hypothetical protein